MIANIKLLLNKFNIDDIIFKIILLLPISTLIQGLPFLSLINKIIIAILTIFLGLGILKDFLEHKKIIILLLFLTISFVISILLCNNFNFNINNLFFYPMFGMFCIYLINSAEEFKKTIIKNKKEELFIVIIWSIIVTISFFFEDSYNIAWGDSKYFVSFSEGVSHRFASSCCFILMLVLCLLYQNKEGIKSKLKLYLMSVLPTICVLLSGARIYLIVALLVLFAGYYLECTNKKFFWITVVPLSIILFIAIMISPMGTKIIATATDKEAVNLLAGITSGRSVFWKYDLDAFFDLNFINQLVGNGVSFVFNVNMEKLNNPIYAHNDYINVLLTYGYFGLFQYLIFIYLVVKKFYKTNKVYIIPSICVFLIYFTTAFLNGFYVYPCTLLSIPIMMLCAQKKELVRENP